MIQINKSNNENIYMNLSLFDRIYRLFKIHFFYQINKNLSCLDKQISELRC